MYCRYCGNDIGASGRFCQFCGKPREELSQDILPEEIPVPEILPQVPPEIPVEENPPEEKPRKQSKGLLKWGLLAAWLLAVAGGWRLGSGFGAAGTAIPPEDARTGGLPPMGAGSTDRK